MQYYPGAPPPYITLPFIVSSSLPILSAILSKKHHYTTPSGSSHLANVTQWLVSEHSTILPRCPPPPLHYPALYLVIVLTYSVGHTVQETPLHNTIGFLTLGKCDTMAGFRTQHNITQVPPPPPPYITLPFTLSSSLPILSDILSKKHHFTTPSGSSHLANVT